MNRWMLAATLGVFVIGAATVWLGQKRPDEAAGPPAPTVDDRAAEETAARAAARDRPSDPAAHRRLAGALRRLARFAEAEGALLRAIQLGLPQPEAQRDVVLLKAAQGDWPPTMDGLFQKVVRENPGDAELLAAVAGAYSAKGRWREAEPLYTALLTREPGHAEWRFRRGTCRMREAFYATAAEDFRAVLAHDHERYEARINLANSLLGDAHMAAAERELLACRAQRPAAPEPLIGLATCAVERGDFPAAERFLDEAARLGGDSPLVLQERAALYLRQERTEQAIAVLKRLLELDPDHRQGHLQLSQAYTAAGNATAAAKHEAVYKELDRKEEERLAARRGMRSPDR
ncbi:tetratricopeptide repeat protein [Gemmata sp. JC717]|uniref:tetratricopeptide repeat protein n=1 Tax=Gemmata algarum TaxID=2975278 RepID=UPI0021BAF458|nr:tetratricopeptide repeat protein [Gemmata algarum]MDY3555203.1 tetratricopeptide repeat protein [Gemmata algarum]